MGGKTIVILGAGVGGLVAANELRQRLRGEHRVVLVERNSRHAFAPSFLWLMTGDRRPEQITRDVRQLVRPGIEVVQAEAQTVDVNNRSVQTSDQTLHYDYLIVALGAELAPELIPGFSNGAGSPAAEVMHTFYTLDGAARLRDALQSSAGGRMAVVVSALPYKCPGAPHEGAMLIADVFRRRGLRDKVEVHLFTPESQPMPVAGPALGKAVQEMLARQGIVFHPQHKLASVDPAARELTFESQDAFRYDLAVVIPPHRGPRLAREAGLANEAGWIPVNATTLQTGHEHVYALGDVTAIPLPGRWKPEVPLILPKAGVFAHAQAQIVARRIAAEITGGSPADTFGGDGYCMLEAGEDLAGFAYGNFFAAPAPQIELRRMGAMWHLGKVLFEKWWLAPQGVRRQTLRLALTVGGKSLGIPIVV